MKKYDFDQLAGHYMKNAAPSLPCSFSQDVLRQIRLRKDNEKASGWLSDISALLSRPGLLAASVAISIFVGIAFPAMARSSSSTQAAENLGLIVFSSAGENIPSGLLAKIR